MVKLLTADEVRAALTKTDVVHALEDAFRQQGRDEVDVPPRLTADVLDDKGWIRMGPAILNGSGYMGFKCMNRRAGLGVRYLVMLYSIETGELLSLMDANSLTTARTAATNAFGTHLLARDDASSVGIVGSGVQARAVLQQLLLLRSFEKVLIHSPRAESRAEFGDYIKRTHGIDATIHDDLGPLAAESDVVVLAFRAPTEPVFHGDWLRAGMHVTGLSSVRPEAREIDDETWNRAGIVIIDDAGSTFQSGDGRSIVASGRKADQFPELWELVAGRTAGRTNTDEMTLFKSSGNSLQDVAAAVAVYERATDLGLGTDLGQFPEVKPYD